MGWVCGQSYRSCRTLTNYLHPGRRIRWKWVALGRLVVDRSLWGPSRPSSRQHTCQPFLGRLDRYGSLRPQPSSNHHRVDALWAALTCRIRDPYRTLHDFYHQLMVAQSFVFLVQKSELLMMPLRASQKASQCWSLACAKRLAEQAGLKESQCRSLVCARKLA